MKRDIRYARHDDGAVVAYEAWGEGDVPILTITTGTPIQPIWEHPARVRFLHLMGSVARCFLIEPRGIGQSESLPLDEIGNTEGWVDDLLLVMDHEGYDEAIICGEAYAGQAAIRFAVEHPERTKGLMLANTFARMLNASDYLIGMPEEILDQLPPLIEASWGTGEVMRTISSDSLDADPSYVEHFAELERLGMTPREAVAFATRLFHSDVRDLLHKVTVPTRVLVSEGVIGVERSRYVAEHIPGAEIVEMTERNFYDTRGAGARDFRTFVTGSDAVSTERRELATVLFSDIVRSTGRAKEFGDAEWARLVDDLDESTQHVVDQAGGQIVKFTGDGHLVTFRTPGAAIEAARSLRAASRALNIALRIGLHTGEVEHLSNGDIAGVSVHIAQRVCDSADTSEILVSSAIPPLVEGTAEVFVDRGTFELRGVERPWKLFQVGS